MQNRFSAFKRRFATTDLFGFSFRAESLYTHGRSKEACELACKLAEEVLNNPEEFIHEPLSMQVRQIGFPGNRPSIRPQPSGLCRGRSAFEANCNLI